MSFINFSCIAGLFVSFVLVGTIIDNLNSCRSDTVIVSKANTFMPVQYSDDSLTKNVPVNESQPFLAHSDVKKSNCKCLFICLFVSLFVCFSVYLKLYAMSLICRT